MLPAHGAYASQGGLDDNILYFEGDQNNRVTGGWNTVGVNTALNAGSIRLGPATSALRSAVNTTDSIDISGYSTVTLDVDYLGSGSMAIAVEYLSTGLRNTVNVSTSGRQDIVINIGATAPANTRLEILTFDTGNSMDIYEIRLD